MPQRPRDMAGASPETMTVRPSFAHPLPRPLHVDVGRGPQWAGHRAGLASQPERWAVTANWSVQLIRGPQELAALEEESTRLAFEMRPRVPFATSGWLTHWWQHYREDRLLVRDRFFVHTVRDENGALIAIAPLMLTDRPATGPLRSRCITFLGVDKNVTELRGLICQPEREGAAVRALLAHFSARRDEWDWFAWDGILRDGEGYRVLTETEGFEWRGETTDYVLSLPDTWEKLRASRSRNIKESLRKCYNSLKRGNHHFTFRVVSDAAELPAALERFFVLHSRRANSNHL